MIQATSIARAAIATACMLCTATVHAADDDPRWFTNRTTCSDAQIEVLSYCQPSEPAEGEVMHTNRGCNEQKLLINRTGKATVKLDLRRYEEHNEDFREAVSLRCVPAGDQRYLYVTFASGGNCDTCETAAIISLDGRWKQYGDRWISATTQQERRDVRKARDGWMRVEPYFLRNITLAPTGDGR